MNKIEYIEKFIETGLYGLTDEAQADLVQRFKSLNSAQESNLTSSRITALYNYVKSLEGDS